jgi:hypothetical protein
VFENRMADMGLDVRGRIFRNEKFHNLYSSPYTIVYPKVSGLSR